jgi:hypothetical protein
MMGWGNYSYTVFLIALALIGLKYLYRFRAVAMGALATRWSLRYSTGDQRIFGGRRPVHYPIAFKNPGFAISRIWNVLDGERNGIRVVIFDSLIGEGRGARACTLFATQTGENLFNGLSWGEKIAQRSGWTVVYRIPFIRIRPWTLSITRIEALLNNL